MLFLLGVSHLTSGYLWHAFSSTIELGQSSPFRSLLYAARFAFVSELSSNATWKWYLVYCFLEQYAAFASILIKM